MKVVLLVGGSGTRLWPYSREKFPKQFLKLFGKSLFQRTLLRFLNSGIFPKDIVVSTNSLHTFLVRDQLKELGIEQGISVVEEPVSRNTAPAIALAIKYAQEVLKSPEDEVFFVAPSDHFLEPEERFSLTSRWQKR